MLGPLTNNLIVIASNLMHVLFILNYILVESVSYFPINCYIISLDFEDRIRCSVTLNFEGSWDTKLLYRQQCNQPPRPEHNTGPESLLPG